jgi:hypothetical protein
MEVLKLEKVDVEIGLIVRDVDDPSIYALIQLEDLEEIVKFYNSFKRKFKKYTNSTHKKKTIVKKRRKLT